MPTNSQVLVENFLNFHVSPSLQSVVNGLLSVMSGQSLELDAKKALLADLYKQWNESESTDVLGQCVAILGLSYYLFPEHRESLLEQLVSAAEEEYPIHKAGIHYVSVAIQLLDTDDEKRDAIRQLEHYTYHPSVEVRQLVVRALGEFIDMRRDQVAPILERVIAEDSDKNDVVRMARQCLGVADPEIAVDTQQRYTLQQADSDDSKEEVEETVVNYDDMSLEELRARLLDGESPIGAGGQYDILEACTKRYVSCQDDEVRNGIIAIFTQYIAVMAFDNFHTNSLQRPLSGLLSNAKSNHVHIQQMFEALYSRLIHPHTPDTVAKVIIDLCVFRHFDPFLVHVVKEVVKRINTDQYNAEGMRYSLQEFFALACDAFFTTPVLQTVDYVHALGELSVRNETSAVVAETLVSFMQGIVSNASHFDITIKRAAVCALRSLYERSDLLIYQVSALRALHQVSMASFDTQLRQFARVQINALYDSNQIGSLVASAVGLGDAQPLDVLERPAGMMNRDWDLYCITHHYQQGHYADCIRLLSDFSDQYESISPMALWIQAKTLRQLGQLDYALDSLRHLESDLPFDPNVKYLQAEIYYLKRRVRRARKMVAELREGYYPEAPNFSAHQLTYLARASESHAVTVYQPDQEAVNGLHAEMMVLLNQMEATVALNELEGAKQYYDTFINNLKAVFGEAVVNEEADSYGMRFDRLIKAQDHYNGGEKDVYPNERERLLRQFVERCIRRKIDGFYHAQYQQFSTRAAYENDLVAQLADSKIASIYADAHPDKEALSLAKLLEKMTSAGLTALPILHFIKQFSTDPRIVGAFTLGISLDVASTYDTMMSLLGLQPWAMTYGEFNIIDMNDAVHTPRLMDVMVGDTQQRPIVFFIPSDIGNDTNKGGVTYNEVKWVMQMLESNPEKLKNFVFVFDAYNYLPYYLLSKSDTFEVNPQGSRQALIQFIEDAVLESDAERVQFRRAMTNADKFQLSDALYQKELLYDWIAIVDYDSACPSDLDDLKLDALGAVRGALISYFTHQDSDQFIEEIKVFARTRTGEEVNQLRSWLSDFMDHEDFDAVMKLDDTAKEQLRALDLKCQITGSPTAGGVFCEPRVQKFDPKADLKPPVGWAALS